MSGHETTIVTGKLSRDPEMKYTASGLAATNLSIPIDRKVGEERKTVWWNITTYGKTAESAKINLRKGSLIRAEGLFSVDKETMCPAVFEKDGVHRSSLRLIANVLTYLDNFGGSEKADKPSDAIQDEIPF